jgi:glucose/mannose-6-phosphate isomerase
MSADPVAGPTNVLDDPSVRERFDTSDMLSRIDALPEQTKSGWQGAMTLDIPNEFRSPSEIVVIGMGGSAIAGDFLRTIAECNGRKPVRVVRGYDLPSYVSGGSLIIACSHSGDTAETLSATSQAIERGLSIVAVTTGGTLAALAQRDGHPLFRYTYKGEPRSALGHQLTALLRIAQQAGVTDGVEAAVQESVGLMRQMRDRLTAAVPTAENPAKQIAARLAGRLPVVFAAGLLAEAAHRWRTQFNENAKCWAFHDELPELDHNTIVGVGLPTDLLPAIHVVFLTHPALKQRYSNRYQATADELTLAGVSCETVNALGESALARVLTAAYMGDYASYYLALLYEVDPSPVPPIVRLKEKLAGA